MRKLLLTTTAVFALSATIAGAEFTTQEFIDMFPGASKIEIKRGALETKVEAIIGNEKIEIIFDTVTNEELKRETEVLTDEELAEELSDDHDDEDHDDDDHDDDDNDDDDDDDEDDDEDEDDEDEDDRSGHDSDDNDED